MTKAQKISEMLLIAYSKTGYMKQAWDEVFGEGSYEKFAGELYDELRGRK